MKYLKTLLALLGIILILMGIFLITTPSGEKVRPILLADNVEFSSEKVTVIPFQSGLNLSQAYDILISIKLVPYFIPPNSTSTPIASIMVLDEENFDKIKVGGTPENSYLAIKGLYQNRTLIIKALIGERKLYFLISSPLSIVQKAIIRIYERFKVVDESSMLAGKITLLIGVAALAITLPFWLKKTKA